MDNLDILSSITDSFGLAKKDVRQIPALTLAYLGDCIFELVIRSMLVEKGIMHVSELNKASSGIVRAGSQAAMLKAIEAELTEDESAVFHRGRNVKSASCAKNATVADYRVATGFEALMGYLYLNGNIERILELVKLGLSERNDK